MKRKETNTEENKLLEVWDKAELARDANAKMLSARVYALSVGGLALSFTVFSFASGELDVPLDYRALIIWFLYLICIVLDTISVWQAKNVASRLEKDIRRRIMNGETMSGDEANTLIDSKNKRIILFNEFVWGVLVLAIVFTAFYTLYLFKSVL